MGDAAGIGPELIARCWGQTEARESARFIVVGSGDVLERVVERLGLRLRVHRIVRPDQAMDSREVIDVLEPQKLSSLGLESVTPGVVDGRAGKGAYLSLLFAIEFARSGQVDGIVTLPICKEALHEAGIQVPGHTEILAEQCGVSEYAMMLYLPPEVGGGPSGLGVAHATLHVPLRRVPELVTVERVERAILLAARGMRELGCARPRVAVAALNPHAGEHGLFGDEERTVIEPAVKRKRQEGVDVVGPIAADTLFARALEGGFDTIVAMYHDQGHVAIKTRAFDHAVNITLGLPIVRTSVAHGTAFDIVGTGQARSRSLIEAVRTAARIVAQRAGREGSAVT
jgi:4-hydroxythreonine-4-phosphate dehydrogenase